jgi:hypothetical protein
MCCLQTMRMLCDSTFLFDKQTRVRTNDLSGRRGTAQDGNRVLSHVTAVSPRAGAANSSRSSIATRDAGCSFPPMPGGVGLNLQVASAVINFEPPWNPARLEQRIVVVSRPLLSSRSSDGWATTFVSPTCFYPAANR